MAPDLCSLLPLPDQGNKQNYKAGGVEAPERKRPDFIGLTTLSDWAGESDGDKGLPPLKRRKLLLSDEQKFTRASQLLPQDRITVMDTEEFEKRL
jgi:hypothetical protein